MDVALWKDLSSSNLGGSSCGIPQAVEFRKKRVQESRAPSRHGGADTYIDIVYDIEGLSHVRYRGSYKKISGSISYTILV